MREVQKSEGRKGDIPETTLPGKKEGQVGYLWKRAEIAVPEYYVRNKEKRRFKSLEMNGKNLKAVCQGRHPEKEETVERYAEDSQERRKSAIRDQRLQGKEGAHADHKMMFRRNIDFPQIVHGTWTGELRGRGNPFL